MLQFRLEEVFFSFSMNEESCKMRSAPETEKGQFEDEALEIIWELAEKNGKVALAELNRELKGEEEQNVLRMGSDGLITIGGGEVQFTQEGRRRARDIIRRHRLAERLFADVLALQDYEADACKFEHAISPGVEEAICTFLGHPPTCPHGKPIPRGACCKLYAHKVTPLVASLLDSQVGLIYKVVFLNTPMIDRLASIGLVAGSTVKLRQKKPSVVLSIDETTMAIEDDVARGIFVKKA
jgi:DtxR family Mn-dependent transcriptional regulator